MGPLAPLGPWRCHYHRHPRLGGVAVPVRLEKARVIIATEGGNLMVGLVHPMASPPANGCHHPNLSPLMGYKYPFRHSFVILEEQIAVWSPGGILMHS